MDGLTPQFTAGPDQILPATSHKTWEASGAVDLQLTESGPASQPPESVHTFFKKVAEKYPKQNALAIKVDKQLKYWTYYEYFNECRTVGKAFIKLGLDRFAGVCIMGFNSPEWIIANFGSIFAGGISAGVYTTNSADACRHLANDCRAQIIVVENQIYLDKFLAIKRFLPDIKAIVQWSGAPSAEGVLSWQELMAIGRNETDDALEERLKLQAVNQCCTLIYTSGTTGPPKGVMCSQDNLTWIGYNLVDLMHLTDCCESFVSYLPFSHLAAHMADIYLSISAASITYFAQPDALKGSLGQTLRESQPTGFMGVPRVWEKIYEKMQEAGSQAGSATRAVASWAKNHGLNYYKALQEGRELGTLEKIQYQLAKTLLLNKVKAALGLSRAHNLISGSAPLGLDVLDYFMSLDLPIIEVYGLSESLSVGTKNSLKHGYYRPGSVGRVVVDLTEIKLTETPMANPNNPGEGEIMMKGRNLFMGYLNLPDKTNETVLDDGWMVTGDLGWMDNDGFVYISGRVKELIITAGGENIPPVIIEEAIKKELSIISNAMLCGDKRKYLAILLTIKCEADEETGGPLDTLTDPVKTWCAERGSNFTTVTELRHEVDTNRQGAIATAVQAAVEKYNTELAISNAQKVQRWTILPHDFSVVTGELNNTLKLKRSVAAQMYADVIEQLYGDGYPNFSIKNKL